EPNKQRGQQQHQSRPPGPRGQLSQLALSKPDEPDQHRRNQEDVVVGGRIPPLPRHAGPIAGKEKRQAGPCTEQQEQRNSPPCRNDSVNISLGRRQAGLRGHRKPSPPRRSSFSIAGRPPKADSQLKLSATNWRAAVAISIARALFPTRPIAADISSSSEKATS